MSDILQGDGVSIIQETLRDAERRGKAENTLQSWRTGLKHFVRWLREEGSNELENPGDTVDDMIKQLEPLHIEHFMGDLVYDRGLAKSSAKQYGAGVSAVYAYLTKKGDYTDETNPYKNADFDGIIYNDGKLRGKMETELKEDDGYVAMDPDDWEAFVEALPAPRLRNELLFRWMYDSGLRTEEVATLRLQDLDRGKKEIKVHSSKTGMSRKVRYSEKMQTLLRMYLDGGDRDRFHYAEDSEYLFPTNRAEHASESITGKIFVEAREESGIDPEPAYIDAQGREKYRLHPHSLRHSFGERLANSGKVNLENVRKWMGHERITTTQMYINPDKETQNQEYDAAINGT